MTTKNMKVQLRRDTASNWTTKNPTLLSGEMGIETDTNKFKFGDGNKTWTQLDYASAGSSGGSATWGNIVGTLSNQVDLNTALSTKVGQTDLISEKDATVLKIKKGKRVINLDTIAFDGKSYREIFEEINLLGSNGGFEDGTYSPLVPNSTNPAVKAPAMSSENADIGTYCMKCFEQASCNAEIKSTGWTSGKKFWVAGRFNCTRYSAGVWGFNAGDNASLVNNPYIVFGQNTTDGYKTLTGLLTWQATGYNLYVGSTRSADMDLYVDNVIVIPETSFTTQPSSDKWTELYETYLNLVRNGEIEEDAYETLVEVKTGFPELECSDQDAYNLFISEMNNYATKIGMTQTTYYDAAGYKAGVQNQNKSRTRDLVKLGYKGMAYPQLVEIWNCPSKTVKSSGRVGTYNLVSTVVDHDGMADVLKTNYYLLGGKTGSLEGMSGGNRFLYVMTLQHKTTGHVITTATITTSADTSSKNRFKACRCLADIAIKLIEADEYGITNSDNISDATVKSEVKTLETEFSSYNGLAGTVFVTPRYPAAMDYALYFGGDGNKQFVYDTNGETVTYCASTTKIMVALMVLKWIPDLHETITLKASDVSPGTGPVFQGGETFTYEDALYLLMLPSSNTLANAIARAVGHKMYNCFNRE